MWGTNIFGKTVEELVMDGMKNKIAMIGDESQIKLQDSMQKIVNDRELSVLYQSVLCCFSIMSLYDKHEFRPVSTTYLSEGIMNLL